MLVRSRPSAPPTLSATETAAPSALVIPELRPHAAPLPATPEPQTLLQKVARFFSIKQLGAAVGGALARGGVSLLGALLSRSAGLPQLDASNRFVPVRGAPLTPAKSGEISLADTFRGLETIGGGPAEARLLEDNLDAWNARWEMLEGAKTSIDSSYFILEKDPFGYAFLGHLLKKQREGVKVRVMTDAMADTFGKHGFKMPLRGKDYLQELVNHGADVRIFHPIWHRPAKLASYAFMASNHDKILAVDGQRSMTGGRNIGIEYFADPADAPAAWRDTDVMLDGEGPAAAMVEAMELELAETDIVHRVHEDLLGNWVQRDAELIGAYLIMDLWLRDPALSSEQKAALRAYPAAREAMAAELVSRAIARLPAEGVERELGHRERSFLTEQAGRLVEQLESRGSRARWEANKAGQSGEVKILKQTSAAGTRVNDFASSLIALADAARDRIVIENPYVVLTEDMIQALERASQRGVEIIIGTNSPLSTDSAVTQAFFLEDWAYILARVPTARIFVATGERKLHAKTATIDDEISIVSTYNLDLLSGYVNSEIGAVMHSRDFNSRMQRVYEADSLDPRNGILEYRIAKDDSGCAILKDGKPVPVFGPEDHLPAKILEDYSGRRKTWGWLRDTLPYFRPLRHPKLAAAQS